MGQGGHEGLVRGYQDGGRVGRVAQTGQDIYVDLGHRAGSAAARPSMNAGLNPPAASATLRDAGVPGVRYLDAGSRGVGAGTSNFVMFDDEPVEIVRRYRDGGQVGGAFEGLVGRDGGARYAAGGLANAPGPEDDIAATQGAASRGLAQAQQMWLAAGRVLGA